MALTGRRSAEIFFSAKFSLPKKKLAWPALIFDGQLKTLYDEAVQHKNDRLTKALQLDALVVIRDGLGSSAMFRAAGSVGVSAQRK